MHSQDKLRLSESKNPGNQLHEIAVGGTAFRCLKTEGYLKNGTGNCGESKAAQVFLLRVSCIDDDLNWPLRGIFW